MLRAVVNGLLETRDCQIVTTLDCAHSDWLRGVDWPVDVVQVEFIDCADAEQVAFDRHIDQSEATFVIAPETDGILRQRVQRVLDRDSVSLNCLPDTILLCGDKLTLANHLATNGIRTIPSWSAELQVEPWGHVESSCVLKLRDGAGSVLTFLIPYRDSASWQHAANQFLEAGAGDRAIIQPWISGQSLSVAGLCHESGNIDLFPIACQHLNPPSFQYLGGSIPARLSLRATAAIRDLVRATCRVVPGLRGYVGFDLILPDTNPETPVIVEINPRLTTSFIGYQQLCCDNLAARMLPMSGTCRTSDRQLSWKPGSIHFGADGTSRFESRQDG